VRQQQRAVSIRAFAPRSRGPRLFGIEATPAPGTPLDALFSSFDREATAATFVPFESS
jgi:hypothetical protein